MWIRLDDQIAHHPKFTAAGAAASWLFVCGLSYCARYLTDGAIPTTAVPTLGCVPRAAQAAAQLVAVGLWEQDAAGYRVHDYHHYQFAVNDVHELHEKRRASGELGGRRSGAMRRAAADARKPVLHADGQSSEASASQNRPESGSNSEANGQAETKQNGSNSEANGQAKTKQNGSNSEANGQAKTNPLPLPSTYPPPPPPEAPATERPSAAQFGIETEAALEDRVGAFFERWRSIFAAASNGASYPLIASAKDYRDCLMLVARYPDDEYLDLVARAFVTAKARQWGEDRKSLGWLVRVSPDIDRELRAVGARPIEVAS